MAIHKSKRVLGKYGEPATLILLSLLSGPKHGYAIMTDVKAEMGIDLGPGTLYAAIAKLLKAGLITPLASEERTRPYEITADGRKEVEDFFSCWKPIFRLAEARLV